MNHPFCLLFGSVIVIFEFLDIRVSTEMFVGYWIRRGSCGLVVCLAMSHCRAKDKHRCLASHRAQAIELVWSKQLFAIFPLAESLRDLFFFPCSKEVRVAFLLLKVLYQVRLFTSG